MRHRWSWASGLIVGALFLSGRGEAQNTLTLYGSADRDWIAAVAAKFEKDTGIRVAWILRESGTSIDE